MLRYTDTFELPGYFTLQDFDFIVERIREVGEADVVRSNKGSARVIGFDVQADDLWDLHERVAQIAQELASDGIEFIPDKDRIRDFQEAS